MSRPTRMERVADEYKDKFPHMKTYAACQSRAFMNGCFTFLAAGATVYVAQELLKDYVPYKRSAFLILPMMVGTIAAYTLTRHHTRICQNMWMAMEEKHSEITSVQDQRGDRREAQEDFRQIAADKLKKKRKRLQSGKESSGDQLLGDSPSQ